LDTIHLRVKPLHGVHGNIDISKDERK